MTKLEELTTFVAVVQEGGLQAASERLAKTQPAISQSLKRLEESLGISLFDRSGYRLSLTTNGRLIFEKAVELLKGAEAFRSFSETLSSGNEQSFKISIHGSLNVERIVDIVHKASDVLDRTVLTFYEDTVFRPIAQVMAGQANIAVMPWDDNMHPHENFETIRIGTVRYEAAIGRALLDQRPQSVSALEWLKKAPQILVRDTSPPHSLEPQLIEDGAHHFVTSHHLKRALIAANIGWGRLDSSSRYDLETPDTEISVLDIVPAIELEVRAVRLPEHVDGSVMRHVWGVFAAMER